MDRSTSLWIAIIGFSLLGATALYSCVPHIREDISAKALAAAGTEAAPSGWASIQVDGQRLVLTGTPPNASRASLLVQKLSAVDGVIEVEDQFSDPRDVESSASDLDGDSKTGFDQLPVASTEKVSSEKVAPTNSPGIGVASSEAADVVTAEPQLTAPGESERSPPVVNPIVDPIVVAPTEGVPIVVAPIAVDPIIAAAEAGPGRPLLSEPLARCQRDIDALLTGSASFFTSASSDITADALPIVDQVAGLLAQCNARAEIAGHTDNSGRTRPNQRLSQARADAIRAHLIVSGVPETQLSSIGFGEERPIVSNRTPEGRRQNRRIEVRIVDGPVSNHLAAPTGNRS